MLAALLSLALSAATYSTTVLRCHDGDTCTLDVAVPAAFGMRLVMVDQDVRLCDINAPELSTGVPGAAARDFLRKLLTTGPVVFEPAVSAAQERRDKYGRWLGWLWVGGVEVNAAMVSAGHALPYTKCPR